MMASSNGAGSSSLDRLDSALNGINHRSVVLTKVTNDCAFLRKLWESAHKWSGNDHAATDEEKKNMHFFCLRIEATAEEMALELIRFREEKMVDDHQVKDKESLNELALDCATKTMRLSAEVEEALDHLYMMWSRGGDGSSGSSSSSSSFVLDAHFCKYLLEYVQPTVSAIETMAANDRDDEDSTVKIHFHSHSLLDTLSYMKWYLLYLIALFDAVQHTHRRHHAHGLPSFDACVGHVLSLALRIANRCSDYWLNCKAGRIQVMRRDLIEFLVNLRSEIHPSNPKFTGFHLNFLMALSYTKLVEFKHSLWNFCFVYLFSGSGKDGHFRDEVFFLLKLFFCATSILDDEDTARSFIPEIQAVLVEITSLFESTGRDDKKLDNSPRFSELLAKICLLEAELFLVVQIHSMKSNTNASSLSSIMFPDFKDIMDHCRQIPSRLRRYSEKLPPETRLDRKKLLALIKSTFKEEKSLHESYRQKEITASVAKNSLLLLRFKIVIFKGGSFLKELLLLKSRNDKRLMAHEKDQTKLFVQKLECIALILSDERIKDTEDVLGAIGESFQRLTYFSYYFLNTQDEMTNLSFSELLDKETHLIKAKLMDLIPKFPEFNFPKTSKLKFLDFLGRNLRELLKYNSASTALAKLVDFVPTIVDIFLAQFHPTSVVVGVEGLFESYKLTLKLPNRNVPKTKTKELHQKGFCNSFSLLNYRS